MNCFDAREDNTVLLIFLRSAKKFGRISDLPLLSVCQCRTFSLSLALKLCKILVILTVSQRTYQFIHKS